MQFETPGPKPVSFVIPDDWWAFADMAAFYRRSDFYPAAGDLERVEIKSVEPPQRGEGVELFRKYKLMPVLFAFQSPECVLPPIWVETCEPLGTMLIAFKMASIASTHQRPLAIRSCQQSSALWQTINVSISSADHPLRSLERSALRRHVAGSANGRFLARSWRLGPTLSGRTVG